MREAESGGAVGPSNGQASAPFRLPSTPPKPSQRKESTAGPKKSLLDRLTGIFCCCASLCRGRSVRPSQFRTVIPNTQIEELPKEGKDENPNRRYLRNEIRTTKYSLLTFIPKNLFEQFHRFANLYFIFVVILNWIPEIEAFGRELSLLPVLFVISVTAVKDAFEDYRRYKSDQKINGSTCRVWDCPSGRYVKRAWKEVSVGDWVHLSCNEKIPADILLLKTSDPLGICYVETSNLDGESNLKQRQVLPSQSAEAQVLQPPAFLATIECEAPNSAIYKFNAFLMHPEGRREPATKDNLLLRGCELRNTDFVEGVVVYAGHDTKSLMNNTGPRYKRSELERLMNWDIVWCFVLLLVMCAVGAIGSGVWLHSFAAPYSVQFLTFSPDLNPLKPELEAFKNFWSYIIVLQIMIPISLYVSVEIIKLGQVFFIVRDKDLYDPVSDKRIQCRALNITEELGQIQYVLSDKTGTLTENKMIFRRCAVAGQDYAPPEPPASSGEASEAGRRPKEETVEDVRCNVRLLQILKALPTKMTLAAALSRAPVEADRAQAKVRATLHPEGGGAEAGGFEGLSPEDRDLFDFFLNMALCNTVVVAAKEHHDNMNASGVFVAEDFAAERSSLAGGPSGASLNRLSVSGLQGAPGGGGTPRGRLPPLGEEAPLAQSSLSPRAAESASVDRTQKARPTPLSVPALDLDGDGSTTTTAGGVPEIRTEEASTSGRASPEESVGAPPASAKAAQSPRTGLFQGLTKGSLPGRASPEESVGAPPASAKAAQSPRTGLFQGLTKGSLPGRASPEESVGAPPASAKAAQSPRTGLFQGLTKGSLPGRASPEESVGAPPASAKAAQSPRTGLFQGLTKGSLPGRASPEESVGAPPASAKAAQSPRTGLFQGLTKGSLPGRASPEESVGAPPASAKAAQSPRTGLFQGLTKGSLPGRASPEESVGAPPASAKAAQSPRTGLFQGLTKGSLPGRASPEESVGAPPASAKAAQSPRTGLFQGLTKGSLPGRASPDESVGAPPASAKAAQSPRTGLFQGLTKGSLPGRASPEESVGAPPASAKAAQSPRTGLFQGLTKGSLPGRASPEESVGAPPASAKAAQSPRTGLFQGLTKGSLPGRASPEESVGAPPASAKAAQSPRTGLFQGLTKGSLPGRASPDESVGAPPASAKAAQSPRTGLFQGLTKGSLPGRASPEESVGAPPASAKAAQSPRTGLFQGLTKGSLPGRASPEESVGAPPASAKAAQSPRTGLFQGLTKGSLPGRASPEESVGAPPASAKAAQSPRTGLFQGLTKGSLPGRASPEESVGAPPASAKAAQSPRTGLFQGLTKGSLPGRASPEESVGAPPASAKAAQSPRTGLFQGLTKGSLPGRASPEESVGAPPASAKAAQSPRTGLFQGLTKGSLPGRASPEESVGAPPASAKAAQSPRTGLFQGLTKGSLPGRASPEESVGAPPASAKAAQSPRTGLFQGLTKGSLPGRASPEESVGAPPASAKAAQSPRTGLFQGLTKGSLPGRASPEESVGAPPASAKAAQSPRTGLFQGLTKGSLPGRASPEESVGAPPASAKAAQSPRTGLFQGLTKGSLPGRASPDESVGAPPASAKAAQSPRTGLFQGLTKGSLPGRASPEESVGAPPASAKAAQSPRTGLFQGLTKGSLPGRASPDESVGAPPASAKAAQSPRTGLFQGLTKGSLPGRASPEESVGAPPASAKAAQSPRTGLFQGLTKGSLPGRASPDESVGAPPASAKAAQSPRTGLFQGLTKGSLPGRASPDESVGAPPASAKAAQSPRTGLFQGLTKGGSFLSLPGFRKRKGDSGASTPAPAPNPIYEAESPDELSLVFAAKAYGFRLMKRQLGHSFVELPDGSRERWTVLHTLPFDSVRKRMSVVLRGPHSPNPVVLSKGADAQMLELLEPRWAASERGQSVVAKTHEFLSLYASLGLRTLCLCRREVPEAEYAAWQQRHAEAEVSLTDREELLFESAQQLEVDFELLGVTGIEDRLQDGVSECIAALRHAGLKVWVLTGDKIETAVNIAYACRLFTFGMSLMQLCAKNESDTRELVGLNLERLKAAQSSGPARREKVGLVIDGRTLAFCLRNRKPGGAASLRRESTAGAAREAERRKETEEKFVELLSRCSSVLCCRATPSQKAHIVRLVKKHMEGKTLAIGDGANDVAMIQSADVGIGISGQEGMQAVMASDFAIARFKFLRRLLLVHGHWCYDRLARTVLYFFYKNALFVFSLFWFQAFCGWSSQVIIDPIYLMIYNLIFTSVPPLLLGVLDQPASDELLLTQPRLYSVGRTGSLYKSYSFWIHMLDALWQSLVIYFVPHLVYTDGDVGLWSFGFLIFSGIVICNQLHLAIDVKSWTWPMLASIVGSVLVYYGFALVYNAIVEAWVENPPYWVAQRMMSSPTYWLALVFITILALLPRLTMRVLGNSLAPPVVLLARLRQRAKLSAAAVDNSPPEPRTWLARFTRANPAVTIEPSSGGAQPVADPVA